MFTLLLVLLIYHTPNIIRETLTFLYVNNNINSWHSLCISTIDSFTICH